MALEPYRGEKEDKRPRVQIVDFGGGSDARDDGGGVIKIRPQSSSTGGGSTGRLDSSMSEYFKQRDQERHEATQAILQQPKAKAGLVSRYLTAPAQRQTDIAQRHSVGSPLDNVRVSLDDSRTQAPQSPSGATLTQPVQSPAKQRIDLQRRAAEPTYKPSQATQSKLGIPDRYSLNLPEQKPLPDEVRRNPYLRDWYSPEVSDAPGTLGDMVGDAKPARGKEPEFLPEDENQKKLRQMQVFVEAQRLGVPIQEESKRPVDPGPRPTKMVGESDRAYSDRLMAWSQIKSQLDRWEPTATGRSFWDIKADVDKALRDEARNYERDQKGVAGRVGAAAQRAGTEALGTATTDLYAGLARLASTAENAIITRLGGNRSNYRPENDYVYQFLNAATGVGKSREQMAKNPLAGGWEDMLAQGVGSTLGFASTGWLGAGLKTGRFIPIAVTGSAVNTEQLYREALDMGASQEDAEKLALWSVLAGSLEAVPISRAFGRFEDAYDIAKGANRATKGRFFKTMLKHGIGEGFEESLQEVTQQGVNNYAIARYIDENRSVFDGMLESGGVGGSVGTLMGVLFSAAGVRRARFDTPEQRQAAFDEVAKIAGEAADRTQANVDRLAQRPDLTEPAETRQETTGIDESGQERTQKSESADDSIPPAAEESRGENTASVKMMVTQSDREAMRNLGYTDDQIRKLRPQEVSDILESGRKPAAQAQAEEQPGDQRTDEEYQSLVEQARREAEAKKSAPVAKPTPPPDQTQKQEAESGRGDSRGYAIRTNNAIISPSTQKPGMVQVTYLYEGRPSGHDNYNSLTEAIRDNWRNINNPTANLAKNNPKYLDHWAEATFEHPYSDKLSDMPYAYVSPLRPLSGVSVDGETSADKSGRVGVLYRDQPLSNDKIESLQLIPATAEALNRYSEGLASKYQKSEEAEDAQPGDRPDRQREVPDTALRDTPVRDTGSTRAEEVPAQRSEPFESDNVRRYKDDPAKLAQDPRAQQNTRIALDLWRGGKKNENTPDVRYITEKRLRSILQKHDRSIVDLDELQAGSLSIFGDYRVSRVPEGMGGGFYVTNISEGKEAEDAQQITQNEASDGGDSARMEAQGDEAPAVQEGRQGVQRGGRGAGEAEEVGKQPWEMTRAEQQEAGPPKGVKPPLGSKWSMSALDMWHSIQVEQAIRRGDIDSHPDYPDLGKQTSPAKPAGKAEQPSEPAKSDTQKPENTPKSPNLANKTTHRLVDKSGNVISQHLSESAAKDANSRAGGIHKVEKIVPKTDTESPEGRESARRDLVSKLPEDMRRLVDKASGMSREQFLDAYTAGLNAQNLTKRETAQNVDRYIRQTLKRSPADFYDNYVKKPEATSPPAAQATAPDLAKLSKKDLITRMRDAGLKPKSSMTKAQMVEALGAQDNPPVANGSQMVDVSATGKHPKPSTDDAIEYDVRSAPLVFPNRQRSGQTTMGGKRDPISFLIKFHQTDADFRKDPTMVYSGGKLIFKDGYKYSFNPAVFGIDTSGMKDGQRIRFPVKALRAERDGRDHITRGIATMSRDKLLELARREGAMPDKPKAVGPAWPLKQQLADSIISKRFAQHQKGSESESTAERLEAKADKALENFKKNQPKGGDPRARGGSTIGKDLAYLSQYVAYKTAAMGVRRGKALVDAVKKLINEVAPHYADRWKDVEKRVRRLHKASLNDDGTVDQERFEREAEKLVAEVSEPPKPPQPAAQPEPDDRGPPYPTVPDEKDKPEGDFPPDTFSARQAQVNQDRERWGKPGLQSRERRTWSMAVDTARKRGFTDPDRAMAKAASVIERPRALDDVETAGLVEHGTKLKREHARLQSEIGKTDDPAVLADLAAQINRVEQDFEVLTNALFASGSEKGRALASQKLTLNMDMDLVSVLNRAKAAKGKKLTDKERSQLEQMTNKHEEYEKKIEELQARIDELMADRTARANSRRRYAKMNKAQKDADLRNRVSRVAELLKAGCD